MATLFQPLWYCGARDVLGAAIATGKAYFYVVGSTSECVDVWEDAGETTPITHDPTHPITLDAGGRAKVYLKDPAKVVITDANDVIKQTIAEGTATDAGLVNCSWSGATESLETVLTDIETNLGDGALYKESSGEGLVERTYHSVLHQFISPFDFDAAGDGTTDDTVAVQNALTRAIAVNLPVNLENGDFKVTAGLSVPAGVTIYGAGRGLAIIRTTDATITPLTIAGGSKAHLHDFSIICPTAGDDDVDALVCAATDSSIEKLSIEGGSGILAGGARTIVRDCDVTINPGGAGAAGYGIKVVSGRIDNCTVDGSDAATGKGFWLYQQSRSTGGRVVDCVTGIDFTGGVDSVAEGAAVVGCTVGAILAGVNSGCRNCTFATTTTLWTYSAPNGFINEGNVNIDDNTPADRVVITSSADDPTLTFKPEFYTNVFDLSYSGTLALTITYPTTIAALPGKRYRILIRTSSGTTISGITFAGGAWYTSTFAPTTLLPYAPSGVLVAELITGSNGALCGAQDWYSASTDMF